MTEKLQVLLLTNYEYGQSSVVLATACALAESPTISKVHIASFKPLESRVHALSSRLPVDQGAKIVWHLVPGLGQIEVQHRDAGFDPDFTVPVFPPATRSLSATVESYATLVRNVIRWTPEEYMHIVDECVKLVEEFDVANTVIVTETAFHQARDACLKLGRKHLIIGPFSLKDVIAKDQKWGAILWKYPLQVYSLSSFSRLADWCCRLGTGFAYPMRWLDIPFNIYLISKMAGFMSGSEQFKKLAPHRKAAGLRETIPFFEDPMPGFQYILPMVAEMDWDLTIHDYVVPCGPIVPPIEKSITPDSELGKWLSARGTRTVFINLGSHVKLDADLTCQTSRAIRETLKRFGDVKVLWKLPTLHKKEVEAVLKEELGEFVDGGERVKIVKWLEEDPLAVLMHENTVCLVHHGGANSYGECV